MTPSAAARGIRAWLGRRSAELRLSLRVTVAGLLAFALAELFGLAQGYWAVLTAVIVIQASVGGSLKAGVDRLLGTLCGAAYGALVALLVPHVEPVARGAALVAAVAPLALLAAFKASFRVAPVTAVIVLLGSAGQQGGPLASAIGRVAEIGLGCIVGFGVSLIVLPARAHGLVVETAGRTLALLADLLAALSLGAAGSAAGGDVGRLNDRLRAALRQLDAVGKEAERERKSRLTEAPDPEPVIRTVRRLRSDLVIIARAAAAPMAEPCRRLLEAPLAEITATTGEFLRAAGDALATGRDPPAPAAVLGALDGYAAAMAELRRAQLTQGLPGEEAGRIFALGFALEQLRSDVQDLTSRAGELADGDRRPEERSS
ncbi:MAG: FUSC family protein [Stellaceae bacterium]